METTELLTIAEMAARLKCHKSWLYQRSREKGPGCIPRVKLGKYLRFNSGEVMEWIKARYGDQQSGRP